MKKPTDNTPPKDSTNSILEGIEKGHKQQEGDERTPEGPYTLDYKT